MIPLLQTRKEFKSFLFVGQERSFPMKFETRTEKSISRNEKKKRMETLFGKVFRFSHSLFWKWKQKKIILRRKSRLMILKERTKKERMMKPILLLIQLLELLFFFLFFLPFRQNKKNQRTSISLSFYSFVSPCDCCFSFFDTGFCFFPS